MMSHLKKKKDLWVCHLFYKPIMLWREWKNSCVRYGRADGESFPMMFYLTG